MTRLGLMLPKLMNAHDGGNATGQSLADPAERQLSPTDQFQDATRACVVNSLVYKVNRR